MEKGKVEVAVEKVDKVPVKKTKAKTEVWVEGVDDRGGIKSLQKVDDKVSGIKAIRKLAAQPGSTYPKYRIVRLLLPATVVKVQTVKKVSLEEADRTRAT